MTTLIEKTCEVVLASLLFTIYYTIQLSPIVVALAFAYIIGKWVAQL